MSDNVSYESLVADACRELFGEDLAAELGRPDPKFGDYATNVALRLSGKLGRPPREIAETLADKLREIPDFSHVEVAGPGFINLRLSNPALLESVNQPLEQKLSDKTVVIETNNPNPFKAMHIGHAFNAILGDSIANLLETGGAHTYRVSYHGDIGSHVGKSMYSLLKFADGNPDKLNEVPPEERNSFMSRMYAEGAKAYKEDEGAKAKIDDLARQSFTREDAVYAAVYDVCKSWSFEQIDRTVKRLGNKPVHRRFLESEADARGVPIVKAHVPGVFIESDGALIFKGSEHGSFDNVFVNSQGFGLYGARDLGLIQLKNEQYHPDKSYMVTAEEQRAYFVGVLAAAKLAMPEIKGETINISSGTVKLTTGKMSSRTGEVVEIAWLFDQAAEAIKSRGGMPDDQLIAGALRYQFLKVRIGSDVIFDVNEAVSLDGHSGPYLQYAHARARSIMAKKPEAQHMPAELEEDERGLMAKITRFNEVVELAIDELLPHHICNYLYELAQVFNRFYEHNRVIDDPRENTRLWLVKVYADTLKRGLDILGIHAPDKM